MLVRWGTLSRVLGYYTYLLQGEFNTRLFCFLPPFLSVYNQGKALLGFFYRSRGKRGQRCCLLFCSCPPSHSSAQSLGQLCSPDALCPMMLPASAKPPTVWFTGSCLSFSIHPLWDSVSLGLLLRQGLTV